ncbi:MAG: alanine racemase [Candidatus Daviesbacteria bacterium]|nr:alanine racemase [Candidatus Daviesbacteria bacterium]
MDWWQTKEFKYKKGKLYFCDYDCEKLAKDYGTPLFLYDGEKFLKNANFLYNSLNKYSDREIRISFMMKSNPSSGLLKLWSKDGFQFVSAASLSEVKLALKSGIKAEKIMYISNTEANDETLRELKKIRVNITINSLSQLKKINDLMIKEVSVRLNPLKIGKTIDDKNGISKNEIFNVFEYAQKKKIVIKGISQHIGSQIIEKNEIAKYFQSTGNLIEMVKRLENKGYECKHLCFGGGLSVPYKKDDSLFPLDDFAKYIFIKTRLLKIKTKVFIFEPGRYLTANTGILLSRVNTVEKKGGNIYIGLDTRVDQTRRGLFHLRYKKYLEIIPCLRRRKKIMAKICVGVFSMKDNFGTQEISEPKLGDIVTFLNMGAYNFCSECFFNYPYAKELLIFKNNIVPMKNSA